MPGPIPPSTQLTSSSVIQAATGTLPNLKTGSIVTAQVIRTDAPNPQTTKLGLQRLQLRLEGQLIAVSSNKPMQPGTTVKLQVTGPNQWMLLPPAATPKPLPAALNTWMQAQRQSLPIQAELGLVIKTLLAQSSSLSNSQNSALSSMAKILLANNSKLTSSMLSKQDLSNPSNISKAIKNSGLMFESKILPKSTPSTRQAGQHTRAGSPVNTGVSTAGDLKSILLKMVHQLTTLKPALTQASTPAAPPHSTAQQGPQSSQSPAQQTPSMPQPSATLKLSQPPSQSPAPAPSQSPQAQIRTTDPLIQPGRSQQTSSRPEQSPTTRPSNPSSANPINPSLIRSAAGSTANPASGTLPTPPPTTAASGSTIGAKANTIATSSMHPNTPLPVSNRAGAEPAQQAMPRSAELIEMVLKQLNGGLAKIQLQQLQSVGSQNQWSNPVNIQNSWLLDLPIFNNPNVDSFNIRIDQEDDQAAHENGKTENGWVITLRFDLDKLGPMTVRARLVGLQVSMDIWSKRPAIVSMIKKEFVTFEQALFAKGLDVKSLACHSGELKEPRPVVEHSLLHVET
ncbi:MAG: flagellar hook-length control protein FliK [Pseudomonadales bacterium]|nr:flagellar hook-length control protein FliK [Pseudomonadales bacterium]